MRERFNASEWNQVLRVPILMFQFVALADQEIQVEEVQAFTTELADALSYKDPLHSEIFADLMRGDNFQTAFDSLMTIGSTSVEAIDEEFSSSRTLLEENLSFDEYHRFFVSLIGTGIMVGEAAGPKGREFSPEEQLALAIFVEKFSVDVEAGERALAAL